MKEEEDEIKISCLFSKKSSSQFFSRSWWWICGRVWVGRLLFVCMNYDKNQIFELSCLLAWCWIFVCLVVKNGAENFFFYKEMKFSYFIVVVDTWCCICLATKDYRLHQFFSILAFFLLIFWLAFVHLFRWFSSNKNDKASRNFSS
jgi:hypothetical protein